MYVLRPTYLGQESPSILKTVLTLEKPYMSSVLALVIH